MCEELNEELDRGDEIMREAVAHLISMGGASQVKGFVEYEGRGYDVTIIVEGTYPGFKTRAKGANDGNV